MIFVRTAMLGLALLDSNAAFTNSSLGFIALDSSDVG
jgi:hypothetical protein